MTVTHAGVRVLLVAIGTMLLSSAFSQTDSGFYYPLNAAPTEYAIPELPYNAQMMHTRSSYLQSRLQEDSIRWLLPVDSFIALPSTMEPKET
jgi:hypothetical protein